MRSLTAGPADERGQTATIGFVLMLGITVAVATVVVTLGGTALTDTERRTQLLQAEQAMTLFDSRASQVAVGDSDVHTIDFGGSGAGGGGGGSGGTYRVDAEAGSVNITLVNYTDTGDNATILETTTLGAVVYQNGDTTIAYQGGGVWRTDGEGNATMISPPEAHYRGATLTFPLIVTEGDGAVSGRASAVVEQSLGARPVYANASATFPNGDDYANPITNGTVLIEIDSTYSRAWGTYFETRTEGKVTYPDGDTVRLELVGVDDLGEFDMPGEGGSISVPGAEDGHSVDEFSITLRPDDTDAANFNNLQWSMYVEDGNQQFELHLTKGSNSGCGTDPLTADATIYYSDDGGSTYHGWHRDDAFTADCKDFDGDGDDEIYFELFLVDDGDDDGDSDDGDEADDTNLSYGTLSSSDLEYFNPGGGTLASPTLDGHGAAWEAFSPSENDNLTTDRLINHYFGELPNEFELTVDDKNSDTVNEDDSSGVLTTTGSGKFVTFLHVTENRIDVSLG